MSWSLSVPNTAKDKATEALDATDTSPAYDTLPEPEKVQVNAARSFIEDVADTVSTPNFAASAYGSTAGGATIAVSVSQLQPPA